MAAQALVLDNPWSQIGSACGKSRADVAVAYVGQGASRLLPLRPGSKLVVDASEAAVRSGQTDPKELLKYFRNDVEVFSQPRLHAKVFAFSNVAFVGSTNVSNHSADHLLEAAVALGSAPAVAQARRFVRALAKSPLGEEFIKELVKIYRPPRFDGPRRLKKSTSRREAIAEATPLRLVKLVRVSWSANEQAADNAGREVARKRKTRGFRLESFAHTRWVRGELGEEVLQVLTESDGTVVLHPPGRVLAVRKVRNEKCSIIVLEVPPKYTRKLSKIRKRLPRETVKRLNHGGRVEPKHAAVLRELWA